MRITPKPFGKFSGCMPNHLVHIRRQITGEPTREQLIQLHRVICKNAALIRSNFNGGAFGCLAAALTADEYNARAHDGQGMRGATPDQAVGETGTQAAQDRITFNLKTASALSYDQSRETQKACISVSTHEKAPD